MAGATFHLYTPQTHMRFVQAILSHRRCCGFSLMEEGGAAYLTPSELSEVYPQTRLRRGDAWRYRWRLRDAHFFEPGSDHVFAVSDEAFPGASNRIVLPDAFAPAAHAPPPDCTTVLAFTPTMTTGRTELDTEFKALRKVFAYLRNEGVDTLHYKLHPIQFNSDEAREIEDNLPTIADPVRVVRLPDWYSLEGMARADSSLLFVVNRSSIGLYASLLGCRVISYSRLIDFLEPQFSGFTKNQPEALLRRMHFLEPES